jgi:acyl-[acyl-carrier-protein] desaturase
MDAHRDVIQSMAGFVEQQLTWLNPVAQSWQPSDLLPDMTADQWSDGVRQLRERAAQLSDEVLVVLVGDTVTEEALPSYQTMVNRHEGIADATGQSDTPWAKWTRGWTAEENRHGQLLTTYLYLCGRVNMRAVELTTQHLIRNGFDPKTANDPYKGLIYTSFQERATRVSHGSVARLANKVGDPILGKMCNLIAGDEARHEEAYKSFVKKILELDPAGGLTAFAEMMKARVTMPARLMADGVTPDLFERFSLVAQRIGVYTARDYARIVEHLVEFWNIPHVAAVTGDAAKAQDYLCGLAAQYYRFADRLEARPADKYLKAPLSWIFDRPV